MDPPAIADAVSIGLWYAHLKIKTIKGIMRSIDDPQSIKRKLKNKPPETLRSLVRSRPVNREKAPFIGVLARAAVLLLFAAQAWFPARAGTFSTDFNSGQPAGCSLVGTAFIDSAGGVGDSGALKLTQAYVYG